MNITRKRFIRHLSGILALSSQVATGFGAYLESDSDEADRDIAVPPRHPIRPRPEHGTPLRTLVGQLEVGDPTNYRGLSVFPLLIRRSESLDLVTLEEALDRDWITISEKSSAAVSELRVRNNSRRKVFLMAGEIITGGKQNRIIRTDVLLPAESGFISVPVYCGEKERWTASKGDFKSSGRMAGYSLRKMAVSAEPQGAIWNQIDSEMAEADVSSGTRDYQELYQDKTVGKEVDACIKHYRRFPRKRTVGAVVVSRGRIVSCDIFSDEDLLEEMWDKICRSFAVQPGALKKTSERRGIDEDDIEEFLDDIESADMSHIHTVGTGDLMRISGSVHGNVLNYRGSVVHAAVFPGGRIVRPRPRPPIEPYPVPQPRYRTGDRLWRKED